MCRAGTTAGPELGHGAPAASTHREFFVTRCARVNLPIDVTLSSRYFLHAIHQGPDYRERAAVYEPVEQLLEAYAKLIVRVGVNVQFGQRVVVRCAIEHAAVARAVATQAYRAGASHVSINYLDPVLQRAAVDYAPENSLGMSLPHDLEGVRAWREDRPAIIALTGNPHPRLMEGADPKRLAASVPLDLVREIMSMLGHGSCGLDRRRRSQSGLGGIHLRHP